MEKQFFTLKLLLDRKLAIFFTSKSNQVAFTSYHQHHFNPLLCPVKKRPPKRDMNLPGGTKRTYGNW